MTVYYDLIFLINLIYQFGILYFTDRILHYGRPAAKIVVASLIQSLLFVVLTVLTFHSRQMAGRLLNLLISFLISMILFGTYSLKKILRLFLTEFVLCILLGGILTLTDNFINNRYLLLTAAGGLVFLGLFVGSLKELFAYAIKDKSCLYEVWLIHKDRRISAKGLLDSGNGLIDPLSKEPVCIIAGELCSRLLNGEDVKHQNGYRLIPYHTIGKKRGIMEAFLIDKMEIRQDSEEDNTFFYHKILCAVSPDGFSKHTAYKMILHPKLI